MPAVERVPETSTAATVVETGACEVVRAESKRLISYGVGSCIVLTAHDQVAKVSGLLRFALPDSKADHAKLLVNSYLFADSGIGLFLDWLRDQGATAANLTLRAAGGAWDTDAGGVGKKNSLALAASLWRNGVMLHGSDLGGMSSRSVWFDTASGRCLIRMECREFADRANRKVGVA